MPAHPFQAPVRPVTADVTFPLDAFDRTHHACGVCGEAPTVVQYPGTRFRCDTHALPATGSADDPFAGLTEEDTL